MSGERDIITPKFNFITDASKFISQIGTTWRPNTSTAKLSSIENKDGYRLNTAMFGAPQYSVSSRNLTSRNGISTPSHQVSESKPKLAKLNTNSAPTNVIAGWYGPPAAKDHLSFTNDEMGILAWSSGGWKREKTTLQGDLSSVERGDNLSSNVRTTKLCRSCTPEFSGLSDYLKDVKHKLNRQTKSLSAGVVGSLRYTTQSNLQRPANLYSAPSSQNRKPSSNSRQLYTGTLSTQSLSSAGQQHIPCKNYNRLHKHKSFADFQQCIKQAIIDNKIANKRSWHVTDPWRLSDSGPEEWALSRRSLRERRYPNVHKNCKSCEPRIAQSTPELCGEDTGTPHADAEEDKFSSASEESNIASETGLSTYKPLMHESTRQQEEGGFFVAVESPDTSQHKTMQEYVEKFYTPPVRQAPPSKGPSQYKKTLPCIVEKEQQRLVENILSYKHLSTVKEREMAHRNRYSALTAGDIRRTTAQLLKTSLLRNSLRTASTPSLTATLTKTLTNNSRSDITTPPGVSLHSVTGPNAMPCRTEGPFKTQNGIRVANSSPFIQNRNQRSS